jgi:uncharacterized GH25 family protein
MNISRAAAALLAVFTAPVVAHDTWLMPGSFAVAPAAELVLDLSSGGEFPALDTAIEPARVLRAAYRIGASTVDIGMRTPAERSLRLTTSLPDTGVAALWVELQPKTVQLTPQEVDEYLAEIGASELVKQRWIASGAKTWREQYSKHAKTFVRVGEVPASDQSWSRPVGMYLEIVPQSDPTRLVVGSELAVRLLREGSTVAGVAVAAQREGGAAAQMQKTDPGGAATFRLDAPGSWLIRCTVLRALPGPEVDWESHFTTLTVHVAGG